MNHVKISLGIHRNRTYIQDNGVIIVPSCLWGCDCSDIHGFSQLKQLESHSGPFVFDFQQSVYKAVERHTSPNWYWVVVCDKHFSSWPLKLSLWNSLVMADRDFPFVSGRKRPTNSADSRQTAPKGTKQNSLNSLCKRK